MAPDRADQPATARKAVQAGPLDQRLGLFSYFGYELPLDRRLAMIRRAGFWHTALWWGPPEPLFAQGRGHEGPDLARAQGLSVQNLHATFEDSNDLWSPQPSVRHAFLRRKLDCLADCTRHGVGCLVMHVTHGKGAPDPTPDGLALMRELAAAARDAGVRLAIENTRRDDIVAAVLGVIDESGIAGLCYDSSHDWLWGAPRTALLARWGHRLLQTHLSDCDAGEIDRHALPGDGCVGWDQVAAAFPRDSYAGCLMLEVMPAGVSDRLAPEAFLEQAMQRARWLGGLLTGGPGEAAR